MEAPRKLPPVVMGAPPNAGPEAAGAAEGVLPGQEKAAAAPAPVPAGVVVVPPPKPKPGAVPAARLPKSGGAAAAGTAEEGEEKTGDVPKAGALLPNAKAGAVLAPAAALVAAVVDVPKAGAACREREA